MNISRFDPLWDALKSVYTIVLIAIGCALIVDLLTGSAFMQQVVLFQMRLMKVDPAAGGFALVTFFGTFHSPLQVAVVFDKVFAAVCLGFAALAYLRALVTVLFQK